MRTFVLSINHENLFSEEKLERRLVRRLEELGYKVTLEEVNSAA